MDNPNYEFLDRLAQNPIIVLFGFVLGIIGIILAMVFYKKSIRYKSPRYEFVTKTIIENLRASLDGLEVRFNNTPQERITITRLAFWNAGTETITSSDITEISPLHICVSAGAKVLDAKVVYETDKTNSLIIKGIIQPQNDDYITAIIFSFDYLDQNEGGIIQIVHTGESSIKISVEGKLKGSKSIRRLGTPAYRLRWFFPGPMRRVATSPTFGWVGVIFYLIIAISGIIVPILYPRYWYYVLLLPFGALGIWAMYTGYSVDQIPRNLQNLG